MKENIPITDPVEMVDPNWMSKTGGYARDKTLRDEFAARAMQSFVAGWIGIKDYPHNDMVVAEHAYRMADAMLAAREGK
jgi:hypothetical protein